MSPTLAPASSAKCIGCMLLWSLFSTAFYCAESVYAAFISRSIKLEDSYDDDWLAPKYSWLKWVANFAILFCRTDSAPFFRLPPLRSIPWTENRQWSMATVIFVSDSLFGNFGRMCLNVRLSYGRVNEYHVSADYASLAWRGFHGNVCQVDDRRKCYGPLLPCRAKSFLDDKKAQNIANCHRDQELLIS